MSATIIPFESRSAKAKTVIVPTAVGQARKTRAAPRLCLGSAVYGFAFATAIQADALPLVLVLGLIAFASLRRG